MEIKKKDGTYNTYQATLSWGELEAIYRSMGTDHANPIADEVYNGLGYFLQGNLPRPGEDEADADKKKADSGDIDAILPDVDGPGSEKDDAIGDIDELAALMNDEDAADANGEKPSA